jgi:hypothetical protein
VSALGDRRRELLRFVAAHRLVVPLHVGTLLAVDEERAVVLLDELAAAGLVSRARLTATGPACYVLTASGAEEVGSWELLTLTPAHQCEPWHTLTSMSSVAAR